MLQVVFFSLLFGIALILVQSEGTATVARFISGMNDVIIKIVDMIMLIAPYGVFALMAGTITAIAGDDLGTILQLLQALGFYSFVVVLGLLLPTCLIRLSTPSDLPMQTA